MDGEPVHSIRGTGTIVFDQRRGQKFYIRAHSNGPLRVKSVTVVK